MSQSPTSSTRLAVLGAGRMGTAVMSGLVSAGWGPNRIVAAEPDPAAAQSVADGLGVSVLPPGEAVAGADIVVVAVKPHHVAGVLAAVAPRLPAECVVVSLAAGVRIEALQAQVPAGTPLVRVMPNTPALVGMGMSVLSPAPDCPPGAVDLAQRVLRAVGEVRVVPESQQDAVTAVSGSGPAYCFYLAEAMIDAAVDLGLPEDLAHDLTVQTMLGAATLMRETPGTPTELRLGVTSPGGTTAAAVRVFEDATVKDTVARAMRACADRSAQLGAS